MADGTGEGEDWETMLETGKLEESISSLSVATSKESSSTSSADRSDLLNGGAAGDTASQPDFGSPTFSGPVRILSNDSRNQYNNCPPSTGAPAGPPQLKILKRPDPPAKDRQGGDSATSKPGLKTLQQREAEYAEARERILGKESETSTATTTTQQPPASASTKNNNKQQQNNARKQQSSDQQQQNGRKSEGGKKMLNGTGPRGPDGTKGFHHHLHHPPPQPPSGFLPPHHYQHPPPPQYHQQMPQQQQFNQQHHHQYHNHHQQPPPPLFHYHNQHYQPPPQYHQQQPPQRR